MDAEEKIEISEMEKFLEEYEVRRTYSDIAIRAATIIVGAMGLIAALAWDEALHHLFKSVFGEAAGLYGELWYAVAVTILATIISVALGRYIVKRRKKRR